MDPIVQEVKNTYFKRHPGIRFKDEEKFIEKVVEIIGDYLEACRKMFQGKNQKQLYKNNNHGSRNRHRLHLVKK